MFVAVVVCGGVLSMGVQVHAHDELPRPPVATVESSGGVGELDRRQPDDGTVVEGVRVDDRNVVLLEGVPVVEGRIIVVTEDQYLFPRLQEPLLDAGADRVVEVGPREILAMVAGDPDTMYAARRDLGEVSGVERTQFDTFVGNLSPQLADEPSDVRFPWWAYTAAGLVAAAAVWFGSRRRT